MAKAKITNVKNHLKHEVYVIDYILKYGYSSEYKSITTIELQKLRIIANAILKNHESKQTRKDIRLT